MAEKRKRDDAEAPSARDIARAALRQGRNLLLFGAAGTGKTHLLRELIEELPGRVLVTSYVARAARVLGGVTIHSAFGLGPTIKHARFKDKLRALGLSTPDREQIERADYIALDEIFMDGKTLRLVDHQLRLLTGRNAPMGGKRVVLCGDPLQIILGKGGLRGLFGSGDELFYALDPVIVELKEQRRIKDLGYLRDCERIREDGNRVATEEFLAGLSVDGATAVERIYADAYTKVLTLTCDTAARVTHWMTRGRGLQAGERGLCIANNHVFGFVNGDTYKILRVGRAPMQAGWSTGPREGVLTPSAFVCSPKTGAEVPVPMFFMISPRVYTIDRAQGQTFEPDDRVLLYCYRSERRSSPHLLLVGLTRVAGRCVFFAGACARTCECHAGPTCSCRASRQSTRPATRSPPA